MGSNPKLSKLILGHSSYITVVARLLSFTLNTISKLHVCGWSEAGRDTVLPNLPQFSYSLVENSQRSTILIQPLWFGTLKLFKMYMINSCRHLDLKLSYLPTLKSHKNKTENFSVLAAEQGCFKCNLSKCPINLFGHILTVLIQSGQVLANLSKFDLI